MVVIAINNLSNMATGCARGKVSVSFGDLLISSDFDSGNLDRVEQVGNEESLEFNVWTAPDCAGTEFENPNSSWFYFKIYTPTNSSGKSITFNVMNMNRQLRLYQQGLTPIVKVGRGNWERMHHKPTYEMINGQFRLSFQYRIMENHRQNVFFAFCYPFSYAECQDKLRRYNDLYSSCNDNIYYHHEVLVYSLEGRSVDLITISSHDGISDQEEPRLPGLFPDTSIPRAKAFPGKKVFVLTSRVHPGETPSSFVFNGFLEFILRRDDPRSVNLRKHYVFLLVPMLNPDGVCKGHFRTDSRGQNLNRYYQDPQLEFHPTVYAVRCLLLHHHHAGHTSSHDLEKSVMPDDYLQISRDSGVAFYVDLHGHVAKRGCFMYGNYFKNEKEQAENMLYPKLISLNSSYFDFQPCVFSEKNMYVSDKRDGLSKEGSGRVALHKAIGIIHSYTLECNYNSGRSFNSLSPATCDHGRATPPRQGTTSIPCKYTPSCYEEVGRGLAVAALDLIGANPWSRLPTSKHGSVAGVRQWVMLHISRMRAKEANKKKCKTTSVSTAWRTAAAPATVLHAANTTITTVTRRPVMVTPGMTQHPVTTTQSPVTTTQHPGSTVQHQVTTLQQRLPQLLQMHKTRIPLPSTSIPIAARIRQAPQAPRRVPAPPPSVKEQKIPKKLLRRISSPNTLDKSQSISIDGHKYVTSETILSV